MHICFDGVADAIFFQKLLSLIYIFECFLFIAASVQECVDISRKGGITSWFWYQFLNKSRFCSTMCICFGGAAGANFIFESCFLWYTWPDNTSRLLNGVTALGTNSVRGDTWLQISIISTSLENPLLYLPTPLGYQKLIITFTVHTFVDYTKGQLNSEWIYEVIVSHQKPTKNYKDFGPTKQTRIVALFFGLFFGL